jgi:hypothetical protein
MTDRPRRLSRTERDAIAARAFVDWASRRYGVDLDDMVTDRTCPRCGLLIGDRPHEPGSTATSCRFSRGGAT